jgi:hypothetical protein
MCAAILALEAVALGLTTPVLVSLADVSWQVGTAIGLGLLVACVVVAGMLRRPSAYVLGWLIQVAAIALGFVVPVMFALGIVFLALWWAAYAVGARIDREKAAYVKPEQGG